MGNSVRPSHAQIRVDEEGIATLTVTNAKSMNILGTPVIQDLVDALAQLRTRENLRALVLRGTGDKAFIGGADIHEMADFDTESAEAFISRLRDLCDALREFPVPVITRISGWCLGGGLEVALSCDLRIGADTSQYGMPEVKVGIPSVIHAALLPRLLGGSRAAWLLLTGDTVDAATAYEWGLIQKLVPASGIDAAVAHTARALAALGPDVIRQQKRLLRSWEDLPLVQAIDESVDAFGHAFSTGEPQKYMNEFKNRKREDRSS
ncbi:enoyl-CoA hydratase [Streptomyces shenzhenensis]|uniref:enoyl-CoA hydratase n=1 Tax=Streptomyces shenzhenensis TaxID=943815 RepID=UPI0033FC062A